MQENEGREKVVGIWKAGDGFLLMLFSFKNVEKITYEIFFFQIENHFINIFVNKFEKLFKLPRGISQGQDRHKVLRNN